MDRITKGYIKDFLKINEIEASQDETLNFERFVNYSIITNEYDGKFDLEDISTGNHAQGIDGIAIIVNGKLVLSSEEITDLLAINKFLEVKFHFIQAKVSEKFEGSQMGNFIFSVKDFFSDEPQLPMTENVTKMHDLYQVIYDNSAKFTKGKPVLRMYYATAGVWKNEVSHQAVINSGKTELEALNLFSEVSFQAIDAGAIQDKYRKNKELTSATFIFKDRITLPEILNIKEAFYGLLPWDEFKKIIISDNGSIKNIFYNNVRDYLGDNPVNASIEQTLVQKKIDLFTVLNNGVTIVASHLNPAGNRFTISDYQIVNGCQTSHVLFDNKEVDEMSALSIPIRLIITEDENVKNEITIATNSQTAVKPEQLAALSQFQKGLEEYYKSFEVNSIKLYYERRVNQYSSDDDVVKSRIVTVPQQIKTFAAMFLDLPHAVSGYYGTIIKNYEKQIFNPEHIMFPYYLSSLAYYKLDYYFRMGIFDRKYKKAKFHLLMVFRILAAKKQPMPGLDVKRKAEPYCKLIDSVLSSDTQSKELFANCIDVLEKCSISLEDKDVFKQRDTTRKLIDFLSPRKAGTLL